MLYKWLFLYTTHYEVSNTAVQQRVSGQNILIMKQHETSHTMCSVDYTRLSVARRYHDQLNNETAVIEVQRGGD